MEGLLILVHHKLGFSLVEILVSLFVVSLVAVNIAALQKVIGDQSRDNSDHALVVELATELMSKALGKTTFSEIEAITLEGDDRKERFTISWVISSDSLPSTLRNVELKIGWLDAVGATQAFTYSKQVSLAMLLKGAAGGSGEGWHYTIPNLLGTNKVNHFEVNASYQRGAYVIYNSQLFKATSMHFVGNEQQREATPPITYGEDGGVSDGWENLGRIDNVELASLFTD